MGRPARSQTEINHLEALRKGVIFRVKQHNIPLRYIADASMYDVSYIYGLLKPHRHLGGISTMIRLNEAIDYILANPEEF